LTPKIAFVDFTHMSGHFGLAGSHNEKPSAQQLLETRPCLDARELYQAGALVEGVETEIKFPDGGSLRARHDFASEIR